MWTNTQRAIIDGPPCHTVVFAGPGSGKTTVLTRHVSTLLERRALHPQQVMVMTFTRQASLELKVRLGKSLPNRVDVEAVRLGTFHAQMFRILLEVNPDVPVLLGQLEQRRLLEVAAAECGLEGAANVRSLQAELTRGKSSWPPGPVAKPFRRAARRYEQLKVRHHRWDFDDILLEVCRLSESGELFLHSVPPAYILMDEFQDTNQAQWHILQHCAFTFGTHLFVVGDDDQSIYGFRGARPEWLIGFADTFPMATRHLLTTNFRSDRSVVQHADRLIRHNHQRVSKDFEVFSRMDGQVQLHIHTDADKQVTSVLAEVARQGQLHPDWTTAVLARTRMELYAVWNRLRRFKSGSVQCRTFHDAKGKEWDVVHILDAVACNPYLLNSDFHRTQDRDEEERRLFYVAMTRARHHVHIHVPNILAGRKSRRSPYVVECGVSLHECHSSID